MNAMTKYSCSSAGLTPIWLVLVRRVAFYFLDKICRVGLVIGFVGVEAWSVEFVYGFICYGFQPMFSAR